MKVMVLLNREDGTMMAQAVGGTITELWLEDLHAGIAVPTKYERHLVDVPDDVPHRNAIAWAEAHARSHPENAT